MLPCGRTRVLEQGRRVPGDVSVSGGVGSVLAVLLRWSQRGTPEGLGYQKRSCAPSGRGWSWRVKQKAKGPGMHMPLWAFLAARCSRLPPSALLLSHRQTGGFGKASLTRLHQGKQAFKLASLCRLRKVKFF